MAIYTNSFQDIMHMYDHNGSKLTYEQKLVRLCEFIFDFGYDYKKDVTFKAFFEPYFIEHFFNEEFAFETLDYFKIKLKNRMQEVLPFYIPLYQTFYVNNIDLTLIEKEEYSENTKSDESSQNNETTQNVGHSTAENTGLDVSSDLPANEISVSNIESVKYATDGKRSKSNAVNDNTSNVNHNATTTHNSNTTHTGERKRTNNGLDNATRYSSEFLNLCNEMINKFNDLFLIIF